MQQKRKKENTQKPITQNINLILVFFLSCGSPFRCNDAVATNNKFKTFFRDDLQKRRKTISRSSLGVVRKWRLGVVQVKSFVVKIATLSSWAGLAPKPRLWVLRVHSDLIPRQPPSNLTYLHISSAVKLSHSQFKIQNMLWRHWNQPPMKEISERFLIVQSLCGDEEKLLCNLFHQMSV